MTLQEANKLAELMATADHGCPCCVESMTEEANKLFSDFMFVFVDPGGIHPVRVEVKEKS